MANTSALDSLASLSDPTRRRIFERLMRGAKPVGELAAGLPVTRPAVSQHLKILKEAGLVTDEAQGTRRIYRIDPRGIGAMRDWLDNHWRQQLDAFASFAAQEAETEAGKP